MYQVNVLLNGDWKYFGECQTKQELDIIVREIMKKMPNKAMQILEDEKVLILLNGSQYQYFYFKNKYILEQNKDFDVVKEYYKQLKR